MQNGFDNILEIASISAPCVKIDGKFVALNRQKEEKTLSKA